MKSGFIALLGKPNVGKSSLMNRLIGEEISIVTPKPQTTRDNIRGILTTDEYQMVFVDTPGRHKPKTELGKYMGKESDAAAKGVDVIVIVLDGSSRPDEGDIEFIKSKLRGGLPVYVVINKTDKAGYGKIYPIISTLSPLTAEEPGRGRIKEIIPTSCVTGENIDKLKKYIASELTDENVYFPLDDITDRPVRFIVGEQIRKKTLLYLQDEIPHGIGITVNAFEEKDGSVYIEADIVCEKDGHKLIIIGDGGRMIKRIGTGARESIEKKLGKKVFLKLYVKVRDDWRNKKNYLRELGYEN